MDQVGQTRAGRLSDAPPASSGATGTAAPSGADPGAFIDQTVRSSRAAVFSKVICPSSRKAKEILGSRLPLGGMTVVELDQHPDGAALQDELERRTGKRTVPHVFLGGQFVGGADDLDALESSGQLDAKLAG